MTQEEKQVLLKDLCARLPYGVIVQYKGHNSIVKNKLLTGSDLDCNMEYYKPYLRPMSSMTEEELSYCRETCKYRNVGQSVLACATYETFAWLLEHHFAFMGLIPKGLAIEVTKENNPYK